MSDGRETRDTDLEEVCELLQEIFEAEQRLRDLGVLRSNKSIDSVWGEFVTAETEGGKLASSGSQRDWDVQVGSVKIQVKTDRKDIGNKWRGEFWIYKSTVDRLAPTDFVVFIRLGQDRSIERYYKVPVGDI